MFFVLGISITVFLLLLLLGKKNKSRADRILFFWFFIILAHQLLFYFQQNEQLYHYPHWLGVAFPIPVLHGVLLFLYALEITGNRLRKPWYLLLHLLPTLSLIILAIPFYMLSGAEKIEVFRNEGRGYEWYSFREHNITLTIGKYNTEDFKSAPALPYVLKLGYYRVFW